jgi:hypothetical protein
MIFSIIAILEATNRLIPGYHLGSPSKFDIYDEEIYTSFVSLNYLYLTI